MMDFLCFSTLLDTQRNAGENASVSFLGGYFRSIFESDVPLWEEQINALVDDTTLNSRHSRTHTLAQD